MAEKMIRKTIEVTQEDIENGVQFECQDCPVALAVKRFCGFDYFAEVDPDSISFMGPRDYIKTVDTPAAASEFIKAFDSSSYAAEPFTFELEIPEAVLN